MKHVVKHHFIIVIFKSYLQLRVVKIVEDKDKTKLYNKIRKLEKDSRTQSAILIILSCVVAVCLYLCIMFLMR
jgi:uncharacterized membrane protein YbhN (UPF0104 family)